MSEDRRSAPRRASDRERGQALQEMADRAITALEQNGQVLTSFGQTLDVIHSTVRSLDQRVGIQNGRVLRGEEQGNDHRERLMVIEAKIRGIERVLGLVGTGLAKGWKPGAVAIGALYAATSWGGVVAEKLSALVPVLP